MSRVTGLARSPFCGSAHSRDNRTGLDDLLDGTRGSPGYGRPGRVPPSHGHALRPRRAVARGVTQTVHELAGVVLDVAQAHELMLEL